MSNTSIVPTPVSDMTLDSDRQCQWIDREPVYLKSIAGMAIDRSEWENEQGAFFRYKETPCRLIADSGHKFCPKHELVDVATIKAAERTGA